MVKEYTVKNALVNFPKVRNYIPKELLREMIKDEKYIIRIDVDENENLSLIEIGYPEDEEWTLHEHKIEG